MSITTTTTTKTTTTITSNHPHADESVLPPQVKPYFLRFLRKNTWRFFETPIYLTDLPLFPGFISILHPTVEGKRISLAIVHQDFSVQRKLSIFPNLAKLYFDLTK
jgi:hypothetical protein